MTTAPSIDAQRASSAEIFDFRHPGRAVQDGIRRLESAHDSFVDRFETIVSNVVGDEVDISLRGVSQSQLGLHLRQMKVTSILLAADLHPHPGEVLLEVSGPAGLCIVERMLGGAGAPGPERRPTDLEESILAPVAQATGEALLEALVPLGVAADTEVRKIDPYVLQAAAGPGFIVTVEYQITIGVGQPIDGLTLVYPLEALQALAEASGRVRPRTDSAEASTPSPFLDLLPEVVVPFAVRLQPSQVHFGEILALEPGDVLRLDHGVDDPALGMVGDIPVLAGRVGQSRNKLALEMTGWLS